MLVLCTESEGLLSVNVKCWTISLYGFISGVIQPCLTTQVLSMAHLNLQISDQAGEQGIEGACSSEMSVSEPHLHSVIMDFICFSAHKLTDGPLLSAHVDMWGYLVGLSHGSRSWLPGPHEELHAVEADTFVKNSWWHDNSDWTETICSFMLNSRGVHTLLSSDDFSATSVRVSTSVKAPAVQFICHIHDNVTIIYTDLHILWMMMTCTSLLVKIYQTVYLLY